jgi:hypothetical protein
MGRQDSKPARPALQRRTRNHICIWVILGGLLNFLVYTLVYAELGGDAKNGGKGRYVSHVTGEVQEGFYISGHFLRGPGGGKAKGVSKWVWIYSYLHSISVWPTQGAMIICMLILARPHIIATLGEGTWIRGPTVITAVMTVVALLYSVLTIWFTIQFVRDLTA